MIVGARHYQRFPDADIESSHARAVERVQEGGEDVLLDVSSFLLLQLVREEKEILSESHHQVLWGADAERLDNVATLSLPGDHFLWKYNLLGGQKCHLLPRLLLQDIDGAVTVGTNKSSGVSNYRGYFPAGNFL